MCMRPSAATFTCAGNEFTAKGKTILTPGWKEIERRFKASFKTDADEDAPELARELQNNRGPDLYPGGGQYHRAFHHAAQALHRRYAFVRYGTCRGRGYAGGRRAPRFGNPINPRFHSGKAGADGICGSFSDQPNTTILQTSMTKAGPYQKYWRPFYNFILILIIDRTCKQSILAFGTCYRLLVHRQRKHISALVMPIELLHIVTYSTDRLRLSNQIISGRHCQPST